MKNIQEIRRCALSRCLHVPMNKLPPKINFDLVAAGAALETLTMQARGDAVNFETVGQNPKGDLGILLAWAQELQEIGAN